MKKIIFLPFICLIFISYIFSSSSCNQCTTQALPDLFAKGVDIAQKPGGFQSGDIAPILISIINIIDATISCPTQDAPSTEFDVQLYHRPVGSGSWQAAGTANYLQPNIVAGSPFNYSPQVKFNVPGDYYIGNMTDAIAKVNERSKDNNFARSGQQNAKSSVTSGIITVASTKEFEDKVQRGEKILYVEFLPDPNLVSVKHVNYK